MNEIPPWRRPPRDHFPGVPAWGAPVSVLPQERFDVAPIGPVTREWAWGGADGAGVRVCVLDSGVEGTHPLVGGLDGALDVITDSDGNLCVTPGEPADSTGHGTACASLIRAIAPRVSLTSVRVLTSGKYGSGAALLAGLNWAIDEGFDVINMSLSRRNPSSATHCANCPTRPTSGAASSSRAPITCRCTAIRGRSRRSSRSPATTAPTQ